MNHPDPTKIRIQAAVQQGQNFLYPANVIQDLMHAVQILQNQLYDIETAFAAYRVAHPEEHVQAATGGDAALLPKEAPVPAPVHRGESDIRPDPEPEEQGSIKNRVRRRPVPGL